MKKVEAFNEAAHAINKPGIDASAAIQDTSALDDLYLDLPGNDWSRPANRSFVRSLNLKRRCVEERQRLVLETSRYMTYIQHERE